MRLLFSSFNVMLSVINSYYFKRRKN